GYGGSDGAASYDSGYVTDSGKTKININIFDDIDDVPWAVDAIVELAEQGIINGKEERRFFPNDKITREETAKLIVAAFLSEYPAVEAEFSDVDENEWYAQYVKIACGCGVFNGMGDGTFGIGSFITREDMAVIAYRTAEYCGLIDGGESGRGADEFVFEDDGSISDYAKKAVYALEKEGIINGVGNGYFEPKGSLTRAQAAKIIYGVYTINR
ncbi:MAG: S-layer homology domain-containing protein, partial [Clostridia bacterium]|nr:S-layer homology domain-containing protein [Clostridia bacterium]